MISIIIPLYNKASLIGRALTSIIAQNCENCEIIVVDDGSTDNGVAVVKTFVEDNRLNNLRIISQNNAGVGAARNRGIAEAKGNLITFLDADDEWKSGHISDLIELSQRYPHCAVFATNYENISADGLTFPNVIRNLTMPGEMGVIENYFEIAAASNPPLWTSAVMVRTDALRAIGGFPEGIKSGEDLLTWARLAAKYEIAYCSNVSAIYHRGSSNPRPPEKIDLLGKEFENLYHYISAEKLNKKNHGMRHYIALWYNMRMSRCLAHRMYCPAWKALWKSLRYRPTIRIAKPLVKFTLIGLQRKG